MTTDHASEIDSRVDRLRRRLRWIAIRGLASAAAGVLVLGLGGRLVMLASRLIHPDAVGRLTENGNRIGEFTLGGTAGLILFGGLFGGLIAGPVWAVVKRWIPDSAMAVGLGALAIGGSQLVQAGNPDFVILRGPGLDVVLLLSVVFLFGVALQVLDGVLDRSLPVARGALSTTIYSIVVAIGLPIMTLTLSSFFSPDFCSCDQPPWWTGLFLGAAAIATLLWWVLDLSGAEAPPRSLRILGRVAVGAATLAGAVHLAGQIIGIL